LRESGFVPHLVLPHSSYLINLGSPDNELLTRSQFAFRDELSRCHRLGLVSFVFHPGYHRHGMDETQCLDQIASFLRRCLDEFSELTLVVENTAGMGSSVGYRFEQLAYLVGGEERIGVCLDTCHLFAAGYDLRTRQGYENTMKEFDQLLGLSHLRAMHLNDSKTDCGSRNDRHQSLGKGYLGFDPFRWIMTDPRLDEIPLILETPNSDLWEEEIRVLKGFCSEG
jgi:deoxyribonuclease-4